MGKGLLSAREVISRVAGEYGLTPKEITGPRRTQTRVRGRVAVIHVLRGQGRSLQEIGEALGHRTARGILYHLRKGA